VGALAGVTVSTRTPSGPDSAAQVSIMPPLRNQPSPPGSVGAVAGASVIPEGHGRRRRRRRRRSDLERDDEMQVYDAGLGVVLAHGGGHQDENNEEQDEADGGGESDRGSLEGSISAGSVGGGSATGIMEHELERVPPRSPGGNSRLRSAS